MRRLVLLVYALVFATELSQAAIVPLLPVLGRSLALSGVETGAVLAATTFVTVVAAVPIGMLADRIGARRLTVAAGGLVALSAVVQGLAPNAAVLIAGRAVFGLAFATIWTAGLKLLSSAAAERRTTAVGATIAVGGAAHLAGPVTSGFLAEHVSVLAPFAIVAVVAAAASAALAVTPGLGRPVAERRRFRDALGAARRQAELRSALVVMAMLGVVAGIVPLLVPLALDANGLSAGQIGLAFSAGAAVWVAASAVAARLGGRVVGVAAAGIGTVALAAVFLLPVVTLATAGIAAFLVLRAGMQAPLSTISYPLTETGARLARIGGGAALGLANVVWAAAAAVTPVVGGALSGVLGIRATFALVSLALGAAGLALLAAHKGRQTPAEVALPAEAG